MLLSVAFCNSTVTNLSVFKDNIYFNWRGNKIYCLYKLKFLDYKIKVC